LPELKEIYQELQFISDRLSAQVRTVALGLLAITWTIFVGESALFKKLSETLGKRLLLVALLSIFALLIDFLQYVLGYIYVDRTRKMAESTALHEIAYDPSSLLWRSRTAFFWTKQLLLVGAIVVFLVVFATYVTG
jgi:hypothetical protein